MHFDFDRLSRSISAGGEALSQVASLIDQSTNGNCRNVRSGAPGMQPP